MNKQDYHIYIACIFVSALSIIIQEQYHCVTDF